MDGLILRNEERCGSTGPLVASLGFNGTIPKMVVYWDLMGFNGSNDIPYIFESVEFSDRDIPKFGGCLILGKTPPINRLPQSLHMGTGRQIEIPGKIKFPVVNHHNPSVINPCHWEIGNP